MDKPKHTAPHLNTHWMRVLLGVIFLSLLHSYRIKQTHSHPKQAIVFRESQIPALAWQTEYVQNERHALCSEIPEPPTFAHLNSATPWHHVTVKSGDSLASVFNRAGLSSNTLQRIITNNPHANLLTKLKPNQTIQLLINNHQLDKLILPLPNTESLVIERDGTSYKTQLHTNALIAKNQLVSATVKNSLYETAKQNHIPYSLIRQMISVFHGEINFARDVRSGDQFTVLYTNYFHGTTSIRTGDILAVSYTTRSKTYYAIRHALSNREFDYFTPEGLSLKPGFLRYPLEFSRISSLFSLSRVHPILHYKRPHQGIDLAAPTGTPVHATGDGRIEKMNRESGYGNMIKISHHNTYESIYAHLLRFEKGLSRGTYVKRGQIIGYVGQTGLADGPHCHYEFHINHTPRNPLTVNLPRASAIPTKQLSAFKHKATQLLNELKRYELTQLSSTNKSKTGKA